MLKTTLLASVFIFCSAYAQETAYKPSPENVKAREWFSNAKFGLFIHWGPFSIPGSGEWVMNQRNITVKNYTRLMNFFNPIEFDARKWVSLAKSAGMKYITLITRHHDGFSMWNTKYSDFNIMHSPFKKDIVKLLADECHKQDIKLFFYYSILDWRREDYQYWTGRTGKGTGRTKRGDWNDYISFMKNQLTELLTNYGKVGGIWFDGYWDQLDDDKNKENKPKVDWHLPEIYQLIHRLQPQCLVGNNHHLSPINGEDFQMFEKDLPGGNTTGFGGASVSSLPLETCETINNSWGFNITDTTYKSHKQLTEYLVKAAGFGANFLLNIGPMPNGDIQPEFVERLTWMGKWMKTFGESIYNTKGGFVRPQDWGAVTERGGKLYIHLLNKKSEEITIKNFPYSGIKSSYSLDSKQPVNAVVENNSLILKGLSVTNALPDQVIVIETMPKM